MTDRPVRVQRMKDELSSINTLLARPKSRRGPWIIRDEWLIALRSAIEREIANAPCEPTDRRET